jgi:hypothetical protein
MTVLQAPARRTIRVAQPVSQATEEACRLDSCRFCGLRNGEDDLFVELHGERPTLPIPGVADSFLSMLCAFPLGHMGGHLLLAPKAHYTSLARLSPEDELRSTVDAVEKTLLGMFPNHWLFTFEHGPGALENRPIKCGGCHVDHAHGHVLVLDRSVAFEEIRALTEETLENLDWDLAVQSRESDRPFADLGSFCGDHPYLHIGALGADGVAFTYKQVSEGQSIPSQLLRKLVATAQGKPNPSHWNWKIALQHNLRDRLDRYGRDALGFKQALREFLATRSAV